MRVLAAIVLLLFYGCVDSNSSGTEEKQLHAPAPVEQSSEPEIIEGEKPAVSTSAEHAPDTSPQDTFALPENAAIYDLWQVHQEDGSYWHFVPLTDSYVWSDHPDSALVDAKYLIAENVEYSTPLPLSTEKRSQFFDRIGVSQSEKLFLYDFTNDKSADFDLADLSLVALLSNYAQGEPFSQFDFVVGLKLKMNLPSDTVDLSTEALGYIGNENPFQQGGMQKIVWAKPSIKFPTVEISPEYTAYFERWQPLDSFQYQQDGFVYFLRNFGPNDFPVARLLLVTREDTQDLPIQMIFIDSEGTYLNALNKDTSQLYDLQWTGRLFKGSPPVVLGFLSHSFGCPRIVFLDRERASIFIRCENRH